MAAASGSRSTREEHIMSRRYPEDTSIEARAARRVRRKMGFYMHAFIFVVVNLALFAANSVTGEPRWAHFPLLGWGLGLAIHGLVTFLSLQGDGLRRSMLAREIEQLRRSEN